MEPLDVSVRVTVDVGEEECLPPLQEEALVRKRRVAELNASRGAAPTAGGEQQRDEEEGAAHDRYGGRVRAGRA